MATRSVGRWMMRKPPEQAEVLLFGFPYAGVGASSYREWPLCFARFATCALQPPGRETRLAEPPYTTHRAFAEGVAPFLAGFDDRPFAFVGHCGAVPFALEAAQVLAERGQRTPSRIFASSWGAPHRGLYGRLNFVDLDRVDLSAEVETLFRKTGSVVRQDFVELAARALRQDLEVQRGYHYDLSRPLPCPVTVVAWTHDDVVPPDQVDNGWEECGEVDHELLDGEHLAFMRCPVALQSVIADRLRG